jgi:hypothetical protein
MPATWTVGPLPLAGGELERGVATGTAVAAPPSLTLPDCAARDPGYAADTEHKSKQHITREPTP